MADAAELDFVNRALTLLVKELASALPDKGGDPDDEELRKHERDAARLMPVAVREGLARAPWPSATRTAVLKKPADQPDYAPALALAVFKVPNDFVRLVRVHGDCNANWRGSEIVARDQATLTIDYVAMLRLSELIYDAALFAYLATHLAFLLARPLTDARTVQAQLFDLREQEFRRSWGSSLGQQRGGFLPLSSVDRRADSVFDPDQERRFR